MQGFIKMIVHGAGTHSEHVSCDYSSKCNQERACHNKACRSAGKLALAVFLDTGRQTKDQGLPNVYVKKKSQNKTKMEINLMLTQAVDEKRLIRRRRRRRRRRPVSLHWRTRT